MIKINKQIKESFFNPVLHFLPLLLFLVVDEIWGVDLAWKISFPIAFFIVIFIFFRYNQIFIWNLIFTFMFMGIGLVTSLKSLFSLPVGMNGVEDKVIVLFFVLLFLVFRKQIQKIIIRIMPKLLPMSNNFDELYKAFWTLFFALTLYVLAKLIIYYSQFDDKFFFYQIIQISFIVFLFIMSAIEIVRVYIIRLKLASEEWWPIVSTQGKIIGSIQHLTSLKDDVKYLHPIVRVLLIDNGMIFMQKRSPEDLIFPGLWDSAISNHVRMGETIEQCIERTSEERYSLKGLKYMYISNYLSETPKEKHYAFLFVSCQLEEINPNQTFIEQTKWWTQQQIQENLEKGIFTDNFEIEFGLLQRSGLLESEKCICNCRLKEVIYQQATSTKE